MTWIDVHPSCPKEPVVAVQDEIGWGFRRFHIAARLEGWHFAAVLSPEQVSLFCRGDDVYVGEGSLE